MIKAEKEFIAKLIFISDSREQNPYDDFSGRKIEISKLDTGDYSLKGFEDKVSIERKSTDLISSLCKGRERFERELERSRKLEYFAIVCECSLKDLVEGNYMSRMNTKAAIQTLNAYSVRYRIPVWYAENRTYGQRMTESLLEKFAIDQLRRFRNVI